MSLISKVVNEEIEASEEKPAGPFTIQRAREEAGKDIKALKQGLDESSLQVTVNNVGTNKWSIRIIVDGPSLKMSELRKILKTDENADGLQIV